MKLICGIYVPRATKMHRLEWSQVKALVALIDQPWDADIAAVLAHMASSWVHVSRI